MFDLRKISRLFYAICFAVMVGSLISHILGNSLVIIGEWELPSWLLDIVLWISYSINTIFCIGFISDKKWNKVGSLVIIFVVMDFIAGYIIPFEVVAWLLPFVYVLTTMIHTKEYKRTAINFFVWCICTIPFQAIMNIVRSSVGKPYQTELGNKEFLLLLAEMLIICLSIYIGGSNMDEKQKVFGKAGRPGSWFFLANENGFRKALRKIKTLVK